MNSHYIEYKNVASKSEAHYKVAKVEVRKRGYRSAAHTNRTWAQKHFAIWEVAADRYELMKSNDTAAHLGTARHS